MRWSIDTGETGKFGCDAKNLRDVLERAMSQHESTAGAQVESGVIMEADKATREDPARSMALHKSAAAARAEFEKTTLPKIQDQMAAGIEAAITIAEHMGGRVTATVAGHHEPNSSVGIFKRMQVFVDRAAPTEDEVPAAKPTAPVLNRSSED